MAISAKEKHRATILKALSDPSTEWPTRSEIALNILKFSSSQALYKIFDAAQLDQIEKQALESRRGRFARYLAQVDKALFAKAIEGDVAACKLCYQRFEGWKETVKNESDVTLKIDPIERLNRAREREEKHLKALAEGEPQEG